MSIIATIRTKLRLWSRFSLPATLLASVLMSAQLCLTANPSYAGAFSDIELESISDSKKSLDDYIGKGKWVVLNIWGTRCPPCREEVPELVHFHDQHGKKDAIVIGIAIDFPSYAYANKKEVIEFADDYFIDFPVFLSDGNITEILGLGPLYGLPTTFLFNPSGQLAARQTGGITQADLEAAIKKYKLSSPDRKETSE